MDRRGCAQLLDGTQSVTGYVRPILIKGKYQIVALTGEQVYDPEGLVTYAVMAMSGARLHYSLTVDEAKCWMERLLDEEALSHPEPSIAKGKRIRR